MIIIISPPIIFIIIIIIIIIIVIITQERSDAFSFIVFSLVIMIQLYKSSNSQHPLKSSTIPPEWVLAVICEKPSPSRGTSVLNARLKMRCL